MTDETGNKTRQNETPYDRAKRVTEEIQGLLKREFADRGGAEAFIQWVRSDDKDTT
jgi:hypothetical protein